MGAPSAAYSGGVVMEFVGGVISGISAIVLWELVKRWQDRHTRTGSWKRRGR